jgi:citrate lyase subunit beta/citryl-CoA lyase
MATLEAITSSRARNLIGDPMNARSYLVVPADRPEQFDKAHASGADIVILDLEDSVAPSAKIAARESVARWLTAEHRVALRINGSASEWFRDDLSFCNRPGISAIVVPKAEEVAGLYEVAVAAPGVALLPLIETARGFEAMPRLARIKAVTRLLFGTVDFRLDLAITGDDEELLYFRSQMVLVSRLANLAAPVDGVCASTADDSRVRDDTTRAKRIGFGGKLCIHPKQISTINECFRPSCEEHAVAPNG